MDEIWKDIEGYEGYQVSSEGRVRSLDRWVVYKNGKKRFRKGMILKPFLNNCGYFQVYLGKNGKQKWLKVHRLVAKAFIPNPDNLPEVNHINEFDKTDNKVENLEWCDRSYNVNYGTGVQRRREKQGKKVYQYTTDNQLVKVWDSLSECVRNGYYNTCITKCCMGVYKQHKGYKWSYEPL